MARQGLSSSDLCQERYVHADAVTQAHDHLLADEAYIDLAELFGALADSTRAKIVHLLLHQELCTCDVAAVIGVTDSCVSQHLRILRGLRLVKSRREGKYVYYSLDDAHIALLVQVGLTHAGHGETTVVDAPIDAVIEEQR